MPSPPQNRLFNSANQDYLVGISSAGNGINIIGHTPAEFSIATGAEMEGRGGTIDISSLGGGGPVAAGLGTIANGTIGGIGAKDLTYSVWKGTSPIQFDLQLLFDAQSNTKQDVHDNLVALLSLPLPFGASGMSAGTVMLGPTPTWYYPERNKITVRIGRQWYFDSVAVTGASMASEQRLDRAGYPIAGGINVSIQTIHVYTKADLALASSSSGASWSNPSRLGFNEVYNAVTGGDQFSGNPNGHTR
jgi:hypothetical protein